MRKIVMVVAGVLAGGLVAVAFHQAKAQTQTYGMWVADVELGSLDKVVVTGRKMGTAPIAATGCPNSDYYVQGVVAIPSGSAPGMSRMTPILFNVTDVPPSTKMGSLASNGSCVDNGTTYYKYTGTVE